MRIFGLDFTSAPSRRKPITLAQAEYREHILKVTDFRLLTNFDDFERFLGTTGTWVAGIDFPFGLPAKLIDNLNWGNTWASYVQTIAEMTIKQFEAVLKNYRDARPKGDKQHRRLVDTRARSVSPMTLYGTPVGRMFFRGAPRLLRSPCNIVPHRINENACTVIESYPALVARRYAGSYKSDTKSKQTAERRRARQQIVDGIRTNLSAHYGFELSLDERYASRFVEDPSGDALDAVLAAIQAAWAYTEKRNNWGVPAGIDPREGWIADPAVR